MKCSIISIGTELSLGLISDSNSAFIAEKLSELGIECNYMFTVPDSMEEIINAVKSGIEYSSIVIISGGLGPTDDDVTRTAVARAIGKKLVRIGELDPSSLKFIRSKRTREINKRVLHTPGHCPHNSQDRQCIRFQGRPGPRQASFLHTGSPKRDEEHVRGRCHAISGGALCF